jgi:hypothetical protein
LIVKKAVLAASSLVLDRNHWPEHINSQSTFGENEVRKLSIRLQSNGRDIIRGFHEGPHPTHFDPANYVDSWLLLKHHSDTDTNSEKQSQDIVSGKNLTRIWNFL